MPEGSSEPPAALIPEYTCEVNEPITLYEGECILETSRGEIPGHSVIRYSWNPTGGPEVVFRPTTFAPEMVRSSLGDDERFIRVPTIGLRADIFARRTRLGQQGDSLTGILQHDVRMGNPSSLSRVLFHIGNFPSVMGETITRGRGWTRGRIHLEDGPWVIDIDPVPQHGTNQPFSERLNDERGFGITHVGYLSRTDSRTFNAEEADVVLVDIGRTLSLARAAQSYPILRTGFNVSGERVWRCWSGFHTDAWQPHATWFSEQRPEILRSVFTGWRLLRGNPNEDVIHAAFGLFLDAHSPNLTCESKLVISQAALEGLASGWPYQPLSGAPTLPTFNSGAARRIAEIAVSLGLPIQVPGDLPELAALQDPNPNAPGLDKMAWVRNSIAHLGNFPRLTGHSWQVKYHAFQFAAWHLELALLRLLDANGLCQNRLSIRWAGEVHPLPWTVQPNIIGQP